jgi:hypothetical protein
MVAHALVHAALALCQRKPSRDPFPEKRQQIRMIITYFLSLAKHWCAIPRRVTKMQLGITIAYHRDGLACIAEPAEDYIK